MQLSPIPSNETQRLDTLLRLNILDTKPEERFDRIVRITQHSFDAPVAFISFVDKNRVWLKSKHNFNLSEGPRDISFCGHAICNEVTNDVSSRLFEVSNAEKDERFFDNPYVTMAKGIRYYMAFILQSEDGYNIGALCIADSRPRTFSDEDKKVFIDLGFLAEAEMNDNRYATTLLASNDSNYANNDVNSTADLANKVSNLSIQFQSLQKQFDAAFKAQGINFREWNILNEIIQIELASPHLICKKLGITPPMMTRKIEALEIKRLIKRWNSKDNDRRFVHLACTKQGINIWQKGIDQINHLTKLHLKDLI